MNFAVATSSDGHLLLLKAASLKPKCVLVKQCSIPLPDFGAVESVATLKHPSSGAVSSAGEQIMLYMALKDGRMARLNLSSLQMELDFCPQLAGRQVRAVHALKKRRSLLIGFDDGSVALWSPLGQGLTVLLTATILVAGGGRVDKMLLSVNCDESHLLVVSSSPSLKQSVKLVSLTNNTSQTLAVAFASSLTSIQFSHFKQSLVACGHDDGSVSLVDIFALKLFKTFPGAHLSSVTSVRFSPFNRYLLVSISMDKRYVLYDVEKQKVVRTVATQNPLNSLSVHPNGVLLAVTSLDGALMVYDLAAGGKVPAFTFNNTADGQSKSHAALDNIEFLSLDKDTAAKVEQVALRMSKSTGNDKVTKNESVQDVRKLTVNLADQSVNYMDVFSPVASKSSAPVINVEMLKKSSINVMAKLQAAAKASPPKDTVVPAPVSETLTSSPAIRDEQKIAAVVTEVVPLPAEIENKENYVSENESNTDASATPVPSQHVSPSKSVRKNVETSKNRHADFPSMHMESSIMYGNMEWAEKKLADLADTIKVQLIGRIENIHLQANNQSVTSQNLASGDFSKTMMSSIIDDCLSEFRTELKSDIQNMHLELLKQFELQNQMIRNMFVQSTQHLKETLSAVVADNAHPFMIHPPHVSEELINTGSQKGGKRTVR